ncbi:MAG: right-handed parallel beta-helix repeat-containing protein [Planctomycetota bacterium]|jgi:hypothetical protein
MTPIHRRLERTSVAAVLGVLVVSLQTAVSQEKPKKDEIPGFTPGPIRNEVVPGRLIVDPPTLENLGFRWYVEGDANRNASVAVSYRKKGETTFKEGLPMLRVHHEVANQTYGPWRTGNLFAGSVLFLEPGTEYEVRLTMRDPDVNEIPSRTVAVATRREPQRFEAGRTVHVYPKGFRGKRSEAAVVGLQAALDRARPGDVLLLSAGVYRGPFTITRSGEPGKPIALTGGGGDAVLEGPDHKTDLVSIEGASDLHLEHLTLRTARTAITAGRKNGPGTSRLVVRQCKIVDCITGLFTYSENSTDWHVADNEIVGINPTWYPRPSKTYMSPAHTGVNLYGRGHVVCYNLITRFSDSLAIANYGPPPDDVEKHCVAIDFYNNDLSFAQDDCLETDYGCHNVRVYRNRCYNAHTGLSVQPSYGGPIYLIRNEVYGMTALSFKLHNYCCGMVVYHNTVCTARTGFQSFNRWQNGHFRNNLILGGKDFSEPGGRVREALALDTGTITPYSSLDYNGYRRNRPGDLIRWYDGQKQAAYASLAEFAEATGHERHGVMVDYDVFQKAGPPEIGVACDPGQYRLELVPGSAAVDRGCRLPNVNDDYTGKAPDLGCYERGSAAPAYGPRPE